MQYLRAFGELNGSIGARSNYHVEALWAQAHIPHFLTTPSFPPISQYADVQQVAPGHPGRIAYCEAHRPGEIDCLEGDWYFYGRMMGNAGMGRSLRRLSRTQRIAGLVDRTFDWLGDREARLELGLGYSRSAGNMNSPGEYVYRKYLAFRGFGGPDCGVGVVADPTAPSGMRLGDPGGAVPGQRACKYFNPFSNGLDYARQPGARFGDQTGNPGYVPAVANDPEVFDWINEEIDLDNTAELLVADVMVTGTWIADVLGYAAGYQFRRFGVSAIPNDAGNLSLNPCPVPGDRACLEQAGPFGFTTGFYPYSDAQAVHRFFVEWSLTLGTRFNGQVAANYEFHRAVSSFDPKAAVRWRISGPLALRGSIQTAFRTPSVDDLNEDRRTTLDYVNVTGTFKAIDTFGNRDLDVERALVYNAGITLDKPRFRVAIDYWGYDVRDMIDVLPYNALVRLYAEGGSSREAVKRYVTCPSGVGTGACDPQLIERLEVELINWPGVSTSGIDGHVVTGFPLGAGAFSAGVNGTWTRTYRVKALLLDGNVLEEGHDAAGYLNRSIPVAPPLPRWKARIFAGYHWGHYSLVSQMNYVSAYGDRESRPPFDEIGRYFTADVNLLYDLPNWGVRLMLSALNITNEAPPFVRWEQAYDGFTHDARGRRIKVGLVYRLKTGGDRAE